MAEQSKNIPGSLLSILNTLTDDLNNDSLEYLLSHFGDLGPHRNEIRSVLPEPDMFYAYWMDPDDFKKEELYIKCYFPGGDVKASYELADLLRTSCSANPFVWRFFIDQHLPILPAVDQATILGLLQRLELDIDVSDNPCLEQSAEPQSNASIWDIVCRTNPQTVHEAIGLEELTDLLDRKFHTSYPNGASSNTHFIRYAALFIVRYLGLHTAEEVCSYYHIAEADLPNLNKEAHQLYKKNIRFRNTVNELIDGIEELLDTV